MKAKLRLSLVTAALCAAGVIAAVATSGAGAAAPCTTHCPPSVVAASPTNVTAHSATFSGLVAPNHSTTTCYFRWGPTSAYGSQTANQSFAPTTSNGEQPVSYTVTGLQDRTGFHYQLVCHNAYGYSYATDVAFTTGDTGPSQIKLSGLTAFVSPGGVGGVFIGCYGERTCVGNSLTLSRSGKVLGSRHFFVIQAQSGGIVHVSLTSSATQALQKDGHYRVSVAATTTDHQSLIGDPGNVVTLHIFR